MKILTLTIVWHQTDVDVYVAKSLNGLVKAYGGGGDNDDIMDWLQSNPTIGSAIQSESEAYVVLDEHDL